MWIMPVKISIMLIILIEEMFIIEE